MMRGAILTLSILLAGCGEPVREGEAARNIAKSAREPAVTTVAASPVRIGELGPSFNACGAAGTTRNVAAGEGLAVLDAPFSAAAEAGSVVSGGRFYVCSRSLDQKWLGIVYDEGGTLAARCGVAAPVAARRDYAGPCASGWVASAFVRFIAGNDEPPPAPPRPAAAFGT